MNSELITALKQALPKGSITENAPLKDYTSFRVGGPAALMIEPFDSGEVRAAVEVLSGFGLGFMVLGNGTNILALDGGISEPIIRIGKSMSGLSRFDNCITAGAGTTLSALARFALENSLTGLEFAAGIPGNVGGGVIMNAGAYGGELKDVVEAVCFIGPDAKEYAVTGDEMEFGYRHSALMDSGCIVTAATFRLRPGKKEEIQAKMQELNSRRREKQPLEYPSAGSTFKRPAGNFAGTLIENAGLKGYAVGGAEVSEKHAGFVINKNNACAADILAVIDHVQRTVYDKDGVLLEPEVRIWGRDV